MKNINKILNEQIELIKPSLEEHKKIENIAGKFISELNKKLKNKRIKAEVFVGGSLAKNTFIKKKKYDIDVFVRFDKNINKDISKLLGSLLKNADRLYGSRNYYQLKKNNIIIEVVPVRKINVPNKAENITDLSYFHVNYVKNKIRKNKRLTDEILLAKAFAHAQDVYGAESYINGFSGYALELLILHYGSFVRFIKDIVKFKDKIIIDDSKFYKNKKDILIELNESKLQSPIILIDPTFKERNAAASLSYETLSKFKKVCNKFLKNPSKKYFEERDLFEEFNKKYKKDEIVIVKTIKQAGDISGTKSKKFYEFFLGKLRKGFNVVRSDFYYDDSKNIAYFFIKRSKKKDELIKGPPINSKNNLIKFKKAHPKAFIKNKFAYFKIKHNLSFENWFKEFKIKNKKIIKDMSIKSIGIGK